MIVHRRLGRCWGAATAGAAVMVLLTGCGGDGSDDDAAPDTSDAVDAVPYVDAVAESLAKEYGGDGLRDDAAQCMAEAVVSQIDLEQLERDGVTPEGLGDVGDLSEVDAAKSDAKALTGELASCRLGDDLMQTLADAFGTRVETIGCIRTSIDDREVAALFASTLLGEEDGGDAAGAAYATELIGGLPDGCARTVSIALLLESETITETQAGCLEQEMSGDVARLMIGPQGSGPEARAAMATLIEACP